MSFRRSSHKSMQRRKSEGTTLRISKTDQTSDSSTGSSSFSIAGRSFARGIRHGTDSSIDQLHINDARTRRISDSGLGTSRFSGGAFAERLQGFAQTVRGLSRSPFSGGQSSPMTSSSSSSTPTTPGFSPQCSFDSKLSVDHRPACHSTAQQQVYPTEYESWDDFLHHYCRGHFPADRPLARPRCGTFPPPQPPYCDGDSDDKRLPYFAAPPPPNEEQRLRALYSFQILQTGTDLNFERIVQLVSTVMGVKGCMIALVDNDKIWIKAHQAVVPQDFPRTDETYPRKASFCTHTILRSPDDPLIVLDSAADWRFQNLPCVTGEPHIRFYAGAPLTSSNGFNIGSLCLLDMEPRTQFTDKEKALLIDFAAVVMREMELWNDQVQLCIRNRMMRDVTRWHQ
ncbi:His Kinase A domain containing protein [Lunasporangiospora selenospora]|uniref:His Kinase A domain containing protein n=1 Tax=Lunasporangiospora selenospora TaxID=979761 RepID=A0A9P6KC54_9FUNG|nr:His Kinase A domain containing protein [Lunasporangiospora selenospora]